ncbi:Alpha/beta-hydrolases family protein isoform 1 [Hibiscus syriacus]|uniref:Alpha/beta-hydrolases family protein isoform 1 n=1 Tax=Hibiscus syriacus TaxID=106335 RepID=A0A6A2YEY1_HIBSY|nr:Alpha/beta-hydrolases family protein isoform 1 [Hibiscus syriacus]
MALFESESVAYGGINTATLFESESVVYGGTNTAAPAQAPQSPQQHMELTRDQSSLSLNKQCSIFSLTLDEIQLKSGKIFGSMNMDEFLANLWNVEENQAPPQVNQNEPCNDKAPTSIRRDGIGGFSHQGRSIQESASSQQKKATPMKTNGTSLAGNYGMGHGIRSSQQKMLTSIQNNSGNMVANFGMGHVMGLGFPGHQIVASNLAAPGNGCTTAYPIFTPSKTVMGESSNVAGTGTGTDRLLQPVMIQNKKRIIDGPLEVVVERRQSPKIKNRESAARSRARKQAHAVELELELNQLKEVNAKLKQLVEENEQRRKQEVTLKHVAAMHLAYLCSMKIIKRKVVDKMRTLRRTVSLG